MLKSTYFLFIMITKYIIIKRKEYNLFTISTLLYMFLRVLKPYKIRQAIETAA